MEGQVVCLATRIFDLEQMKAGMKLVGPVILLNKTSTILVEPKCVAQVDDCGNVSIRVGDSSNMADLT